MGSSTLWGKITVLIAVCGWCLSAQAKYAGGSGEPNNPYQISSVPDWQELMATPADWASHFVLTGDIDLNDVPITRIGNSTNPFTGVFDGNDYVVRNVDVNMPGTNSVGLFGYVSGANAEIKNLTLIDPNVDAGTYDYVGSLVGYLSSGTVINCSVQGGSVRGDYYVGGLVGRNSSGTITDCYSITGSVMGHDTVGGLVGYTSSGTVSNCFSSSSVTGDYCVGGLVGYTSYGSVSNCYSDGSVTGGSYLGGLVGRNSYGTISDSYSTGSVTGGSYLGGLVGYNSSGAISNCYSTGSVTGGSHLGGLVGNNSSGAISNCYSAGSVNGAGGYVGGLVGDTSQGTITNCYSEGSVTGDDYVGGLMGYIGAGIVTNCYSTGSVAGADKKGGLVGYSSGYVVNCYWDTETSGQTVSAGGEGNTTAAMMTANTFFGWGTCEAVWTISEGEDYPRLAWEEKPGELIANTFPLEGNGDSNSPYLIHTAEELNAVGSVPCVWDKHFKLVADIDLSDYKGEGFNVIGLASYVVFSGVFDGNNHRISNFTYPSTTTNYVGLFGWASGENVEIKNLTLIDPNIDAGTSDYVGCLVGRLSNGAVANCSAQGGKIAGFNYVGGLIGSADSATVTGCSATAGVLGCNYVGGLTGSYANGIIKNCNAAGAVAGYDYVGGLAGRVSGAVTTSYAAGSVWAERNVGGLIGNSYGSATVDKCYATGPVVGGEYAGGLVGYNSRTVTNCYATGDVWADGYAGGLLGYNTAAVTNCYSTSAVWALNYSYLGGLVGYGTSSNVENSFWNTEISGLLTSRGGTGQDTAALQRQTTFTDAGWDFVGEDENGSEDIWRLCNQGSEYPKLVWQYLPGDFLCPDYVDFLDFAQLGRWWLDPDPCAADLTGDGIINAQDLIVESYNWLMGMAPGRPGNPEPPNFAKQASWYGDLAWTPALFAQSYDVYFGTSTPPPFVTNQSATTFSPGTMEYQTSYYWRIDPVNTWGQTAGPLWTFTTASPAQATNPYPFDDQMNAGTNTGLKWDAGSGAVSHDIYFGTTNPPPFLRNQTAASFYQAGLTYRTRYYWRIDEVSAGGTTTGVVWNFTTGASTR
jgi:hypothetical protein